MDKIISVGAYNEPYVIINRQYFAIKMDGDILVHLFRMIIIANTIRREFDYKVSYLKEFSCKVNGGIRYAHVIKNKKTRKVIEKRIIIYRKQPLSSISYEDEK